MTLEKVVIIIPTYNEALVIEETLHAIFRETQVINHHDIHVLIFDSSSTDKTQDKILALQNQYENLHLKTESQKSGLGSAYLQAMRYALDSMSADIIMEFDADLSHQPKYIPAMLNKIENYDVVVGSRYVTGGGIPKNWGWHRKFLSLMGNYISRLILTSKYKDFTSGFRATRARALRAILPDKFISTGYAYKLQLLWLLHKTGFQIYEHPILFVDREKGQSKLPANSIMDSLNVLITLRFYELQRYFKMCLVGLSGMTIQVIVYNILRNYIPPYRAIKIAVIAAIINNFILNKHYTFKQTTDENKLKKMKSFSLFILYSLAMIGFQSHWLQLGIKYLGAGHLKENLIMATGILIGSVLNYFVYSRIVWQENGKLISS